MSRSYAIIGAGALGGYYGALLHHDAAREVHFLLRGDFAHVREHGLKVFTTRGDRSIARPNIHARPADMPRCDIALVALKSTQNHLLADILPHALKPDGVVLVMQNGLGVEADAAAVVGSDRVLGGLAFLCSNKTGPGRIHQIDYGSVRLGEYDAANRPGGLTPRLRSVADDFRRAGVQVDLEEDLVLARWKKLVWNVPFNGLAVVLNASTDALMKHPATRALCRDLMGEVLAGAASMGRRLDDDYADQMMDYTDRMAAYKPSMMLDFQAGRPMELRAIYGNPIRAAAQAGVWLPRMSMLHAQLQALDRPGPL
jgi:2-dehydropantoate 2-reductase